MKRFDNIEGRKLERWHDYYVGYARGAWRIKRNGKRWLAYYQHGPDVMGADTLAEMSRKLKAFEDRPERARKYKIAWSTHVAGVLVELSQRGPEDFCVIYGTQVVAPLTYADACAKLGQALLHGLSCDDKVDNREEGEDE